MQFTIISLKNRSVKSFFAFFEKNFCFFYLYTKKGRPKIENVEKGGKFWRSATKTENQGAKIGKFHKRKKKKNIFSKPLAFWIQMWYNIRVYG